MRESERIRWWALTDKGLLTIGRPTPSQVAALVPVPLLDVPWRDDKEDER